MRRLTSLTLLLCALGAPAASAAGPSQTRASLERTMRSAGSYAGVLAVNADTGSVIASVRPDAARIPASVQKLYTTAAAILRFGEDGQLTTSALAAAAPDENGVIDGDLILRGGGDPSLSPGGLQILADRVAEAGVTRVRGDLLADETAFDLLRGPPSEGFRASVDIQPLSALAYIRRWTSAKKLAVLFRRSLRRAGVSVRGRALTGRAPVKSVVLGELGSPRMSELARRANVPSDNWISELMLKALGREFGTRGSTAAGATVVRNTLRSQFGFAARVADGSGLSRGNRTSPRQVVRLLTGMYERDESNAFDRSLAVAGLTGTLHDRMRGTAAAGRCRGKTGTIRGVSNLAGYCDTPSGTRVAFAILMNGVNPAGARRLQDRMVSALARFTP